jgi:hypothetical protein
LRLARREKSWRDFIKDFLGQDTSVLFRKYPAISSDY